jgi:hypothetical protein
VLQYVTNGRDVPFPIIADPEHNIYNLYNLDKSWWGYVRGAVSRRMVEAASLKLGGNDADGIQNLLPADFLISPKQTIHTAFYGCDIGDHIPFEQIDLFLASE